MIRKKTLIKDLEEMSGMFIKIGVLYQSMALNVKKANKEEINDIQNHVIKRIDATEDYLKKMGLATK